MINPKQAVKLNKRKLALNIVRISGILIGQIDEVLADEIDSLIERKPQEFSMRQFADAYLENKDRIIFHKNRLAITQDIEKKYNNNGWDALIIAESDIVMSIKIA